MIMNDADRAAPAPHRRRRFMVMVAFLGLALVVGCSSETAVGRASPPETDTTADTGMTDTTDTTDRTDTTDTTAETDTTADPSANPEPAAAPAAENTEPDASELSEPDSPQPTPTPHPISVADTELPQAPIGFDDLFETVAGPQPVTIEIEDIGVRSAAVIPVGVNPDDLSFEVPPADQVGWYEFGPAPGEAGSSVLAAHIAYNGVDGVFRYLEDVEVGAIVVVGFDDGSSQRYRIEEVTEYVKEELPDSLFARDGKEQLALITCGGTFNDQLDSYESNTVAIAVPLA